MLYYLYLTTNTIFTLKAISVEFGVQVGKACLIGKHVNCVDSSLSSATLQLRFIDGVTYATVQKPAFTAHIKALLPGSIQVACGGQGCVLTLAVSHGFTVSKSVKCTCVEKMSCKNTQSVSIDVKNSTGLIFLIFVLFQTDRKPLTSWFVHIAVHIIFFIRRTQSVRSHTGNLFQITRTLLAWGDNGISA